MRNVLVTSPIPSVGLDILSRAGLGVTVLKKPLKSKDLIKEIAKGKYDAVLTALTDDVDEAFIKASPHLKVVSNYAVGYNNFHPEAFVGTDVIPCHTPIDGYSVAEFSASLIVTLARQTLSADSFVREGRYKGFDPSLFVGQSLKGKTLGILGTGHIGKDTALIMHNGFSMDVVYYDVVRNLELENRTKAKFVSSPLEVAGLSDVVSVHVPLLDSTHHLVNAAFLSAMKPSAFLINTSRGPVVDELALIAALEKGTIKGAALDVYEFEPKVSKKLLSMKDKTVLTPHIGSATEWARNDMSKIAAQNIIDALAGKIPTGIVKF